MKLSILTMMIGLSFSLSVFAVERDRAGGMGARSIDGGYRLDAEGLTLEILPFTFQVRGLEGGKIMITADGKETFAFYHGLFNQYVKEEPSQILTFIDRQIIYARGVSCVRLFGSESWELIENGDWEPKDWDKYSCRFIMNLRTGQTNSVAMIEPRPRFGMGN